jgi:hypothetical protein
LLMLIPGYLFFILSLASFNVLADCNKPSINGQFCQAVEAAINNDARTKFANFSIEKNLFQEIRSAFHDQNCDKDRDNLGHCQAVLSFQKDQCQEGFLSIEKEKRYHMKIICNTFVYAKNGGVCENLKVMTTNSTDINSEELAGICEGYQSTMGIVPAVNNALEIKKKIHKFAGSLAGYKDTKFIDQDNTKKPISAKRKLPMKTAKAKITKKELHLVVGSTRQTEGTLGTLTDRICNFKNADLSHRFTFSQKATTMDLADCSIEGLPHIVADARIYDFSECIISSVLFEKFSTRARDGGKNYLGQAIENIAKSMKSGALMEIEWLPETTLSFSADPEKLAAKTKANPFHGFLNGKVVFQSFLILGGDKVESLEPELRGQTVEMAKKIRKQIEFYCRQGIGKSVDELISILNLEAKIMLEMVNRNSDVLINYVVKDQDFYKLRDAHERITYEKFVPKAIGILVLESNPLDLAPGRIYDLVRFMEDTFLNFVVEDMIAETNRVYVMRYIESLAFGDVTIEKGDNPHNGRKNAWMIRATKL